MARGIMTEDRRWLSIREVATYLGIHYVTAYRKAIKGKLPVARIAGIIRVDKKRLDELMERSIREGVNAESRVDRRRLW